MKKLRSALLIPRYSLTEATSCLPQSKRPGIGSLPEAALVPDGDGRWRLIVVAGEAR
jgi:hypothetical protein